MAAEEWKCNDEFVCLYVFAGLATKRKGEAEWLGRRGQWSRSSVGMRGRAGRKELQQWARICCKSGG